MLGHYRFRVQTGSLIVSLLLMMGLCRSFSSTASATISASSSTLNIAVISGSTRKQGPPSPVLGPRVTKLVVTLLEERGNIVTHIDPSDFQLLEKPEFCFARSAVPPHLETTRRLLEQSDAYVCVTPEYNHAPSPGLVNVLNHFGSSVFSFKPSGIVTYSAGQWGGTRAAIGLRPILSELGCLPVSAMIHIPHAQDVVKEDGSLIPSQDLETTWKSYTDRCFSQVEWWAAAAKNQKLVADPFAISKPFQSSPSQRDDPSSSN